MEKYSLIVFTAHTAVISMIGSKEDIMKDLLTRSLQVEANPPSREQVFSASKAMEYYEQRWKPMPKGNEDGIPITLWYEDYQGGYTGSGFGFFIHKME